MNGLALCAGGGGLELGLALALGDAYRTVCFVEREVYAASILVSRMEEGRLHPAPVWDDLTTFDGRRWRGCVDLLSAGFPCQPFSAAGKRQADDDSRHLWPHVRRVINGARPALVFLENVSAIVSTRQADGRPAYMVVRTELERLGYGVTQTLVRASDVGAPHQRERLFILAHHRSAGLQDTEQERQPGRSTPEFRGPMGYASDRDGWTGWTGAERDQPGPRPATGGGTMGVSDSARRTPPWLGRDEHAGSEPEAGCRTMGYTPGGEFKGRRGDTGARPGAGVAVLADTWNRQLQEPGRGPQARDGTGSGGAGAGMADAQRAATRGVSGELDGTQGTGEGEGQERERVWGAARHASAAFPPGPGDKRAWAAILAERPELAPAVEPLIRGMADGVARALEHRTQRLRLLGNGVVPLAAAFAFRTCADALGLAIEELHHTHTGDAHDSRPGAHA
jgi:DNA (cytosine-5)-methyltransferase 1